MTTIIEINHVSVKFQQKTKKQAAARQAINDDAETESYPKTATSPDKNSNWLTAVDDASLRVEKGDIFGVIGYSGAGKSTLVRLINLLQKPTSGQIIVNGRTIFDSAHPVRFRGSKLRDFRQKIGMIFQHFNLLDEKTVFKNVEFALAHTLTVDDKKVEKFKQTHDAAAFEKLTAAKKLPQRYLTPAEKKEKVTKLLELVDLSDLADKYPSQLSGGQKQRVAIARALANDPEILISDEATSALDPKTTNQILDLLKDLHDRLGLTIVLITHEMAVVKEIANKVAVMQNGRIIEQNSLIDIFAKPQQELTKQFIETTSSVNRFIAGIAKTDILAKLAPDEELVHIDFGSNDIVEPVISVINKQFDVTTSIFYGNVELLQGSSFGSLVITLKGPENARAGAKAYLEKLHLSYEILGSIAQDKQEEVEKQEVAP